MWKTIFPQSGGGKGGIILVSPTTHLLLGGRFLTGHALAMVPALETPVLKDAMMEETEGRSTLRTRHGWKCVELPCPAQICHHPDIFMCSLIPNHKPHYLRVFMEIQLHSHKELPKRIRRKICHSEEQE